MLRVPHVVWTACSPHRLLLEGYVHFYTKQPFKTTVLHWCLISQNHCILFVPCIHEEMENYTDCLSVRILKLQEKLYQTTRSSVL